MVAVLKVVEAVELGALMEVVIKVVEMETMVEVILVALDVRYVESVGEGTEMIADLGQ